MKARLSEFQHRKGFALLAALATMIILAGVAAGLSKASFDNLKYGDLQLLRMKAKLAAEGAVDAAIASCKANPQQARIEQSLKPLEMGAQQISASYVVERVKAARFGKALAALPAEQELLWVRATGTAKRGPNALSTQGIRAVVIAEPDQSRVLLWTVE